MKYRLIALYILVCSLVGFLGVFHTAKENHANTESLSFWMEVTGMSLFGIAGVMILTLAIGAIIIALYVAIVGRLPKRLAKLLK